MKQFLMPVESPKIRGSAFIAPGAVVVGAVTVGEEASIWYQCVLRADINRIFIGAQSNIQDGTIVHLADEFPVIVGERVSVGHRAIIHACEIGDETLVGMGAIIMDGAVIGPRCVVAAGALVTKGFRAPEGSLIIGTPAKIVRELTVKERVANAALAAKYVEVSRRFKDMAEEHIRPR